MTSALSDQRTSEIDTLRGFALMGIAVVNVPLFSEVVTGRPVVASGLDALAAFIGATFFTAKFFVLFAFLFGWGMHRMRENAVEKGLDAPRMWRRRMWALMLIGLAHGILVFPFDILMTYGVLGMWLWKASDWPRAKLVKHALVALSIAPFSYALLGWLNGTIIDSVDSLEREKVGFLTYGAAVLDNLWTLPFGQMLNVLYNGPTSYAAICLGVLASRDGLFAHGARAFSTLEGRAPLLWVLGISLNLPLGFVSVFENAGPVAEAFAFAATGLGAPFLSAAYLISVAKLARTGRQFFAAAGRMSLTAYVVEGILAGWIFFEYGLGLNMELGAGVTLAVALGVFLATKLFCMLWLQFWRQGPLERLWRKLAYASEPSRTPGP